MDEPGICSWKLENPIDVRFWADDELPLPNLVKEGLPTGSYLATSKVALTERVSACELGREHRARAFVDWQTAASVR